MGIGCKLGCDPEYHVLVTDRCGGATVAELAFSDLKWGRALDAVSEASVTIPPGKCGRLADVRTWRHELHVIRDNDEVWSGPVTTVPQCRSGTTLVAQDFWAWLGVRVIHNQLCFDPTCGGTAATGVAIAQALIEDALAPDDPCLLKYLHAVAGGTTQERNYAANSAYALDALTDLAKGGLDFTAIGRRLVIMPEGGTLGQLALLTCDAFDGDVCTTEDGGAAATRAVVTGKAADGTTVVSGSAGGVDDYLGLVEVLVNDDSVRTATAAQTQAAGLLQPIPPLLVQPPQGNGLTAEAPVCINELVPGVLVPVAMDCTCRPAEQMLRLTKLDVSVDAGGEKVAPLLSPVGATD